VNRYKTRKSRSRGGWARRGKDKGEKGDEAGGGEQVGRAEGGGGL
jgi:hypothetical protein